MAHKGYDCTNGGVSSKADAALVIGAGIPEIFEAGDMPVLILAMGNMPGCAKLIPAEGPDRHPMFGGNYGACSDSRFCQAVEIIVGGRFYGAVPIHDRFE